MGRCSQGSGHGICVGIGYQRACVRPGSAVVWVWNVLHRLVCLNIWSPAGGAVWENCVTFWRWSHWREAGRCMGLGIFFPTLCLCPLLSTLWQSTASLAPTIPAKVRLHPLKPQAKTIPPFSILCHTLRFRIRDKSLIQDPGVLTSHCSILPCPGSTQCFSVCTVGTGPFDSCYLPRCRD